MLPRMGRGWDGRAVQATRGASRAVVLPLGIMTILVEIMEKGQKVGVDRCVLVSVCVCVLDGLMRGGWGKWEKKKKKEEKEEGKKGRKMIGRERQKRIGTEPRKNPQVKSPSVQVNSQFSFQNPEKNTPFKSRRTPRDWEH